MSCDGVGFWLLTVLELSCSSASLISHVSVWFNTVSIYLITASYSNQILVSLIHSLPVAGSNFSTLNKDAGPFFCDTELNPLEFQPMTFCATVSQHFHNCSLQVTGNSFTWEKVEDSIFQLQRAQPDGAWARIHNLLSMSDSLLTELARQLSTKSTKNAKNVWIWSMPWLSSHILSIPC